MGLFDWVNPRKPNVEVLDDVIWMTKAAKFGGISTATRQCFEGIDASAGVLIVAHFQVVLDEVNRGIPAPPSTGDTRVYSALAKSLVAAENSIDTFDPSQSMDIIVAERHPLASHDDEVVAFASRLPCRCRLVFHLSLEDALMKLFAGSWVKGVLANLGMSEDEAIRSSMVARRIKDAQKKIARGSRSDTPADSAEQWLELNFSS